MCADDPDRAVQSTSEILAQQLAAIADAVAPYRGFAAVVNWSDADDCFVGALTGIADLVGFHAQTVDELRAAFIEAADDYAEACLELGKPLPQE